MIVARLVLVMSITVALQASASFASASGIRFLPDDREAYQARVDLIQRASTQICLAYYAVDTTEAPMALLELLRQAGERGVSVRLLVDGLMTRLPAGFERYLRCQGVQMRVYHGTRHGKPLWLNRRMHSKLLIADSHHLIIGSRNLRNNHFGLAKDGYIDCDAYLFGDIACQSQAYFDQLWSSADVQAPTDKDSFTRSLPSIQLPNVHLPSIRLPSIHLHGETPWAEAWRKAERPSQYQCLLNQSVERMQCRMGVQLHSANDWSADAIYPIEADLLHGCRCDKPGPQMQQGIIRLIDSASCSLVIESPYPAFTKEVRNAILRASDRGVCVSILTNSLKSTDQLSVFAAYQNDKRRLLKHGVALYEYCGDDCLHAKSMLIDDCTWMLGSYNFDSRSDTYNLEICVVVSDATTAGLLQQSVAQRMSKSKRIADDTLILETVDGNDKLRRLRMILTRTCVEFYRRLL